MIYSSIIDCIHNTPLVRLPVFSATYNRNIFIKLEGDNPTGSMKDRVALYCIEQAEKNGIVRPGTTIIESSSGSLAVSLALVGTHKGYQVICVVDPKLSTANQRLIEAYGGKVVMAIDADKSGNFLTARINMVQHLVNSTPNAWWFNQYSNADHPLTHYNYTAKEIYQDLKGQVDWIVCTAGTGGSLSGLSMFFKRYVPSCKIMAIDANGSVVLGGKPGPRRQVGHGSSRPSNFLDFDLINEKVYVSDDEAFSAAQLLAKKEFLFLGGSSGAAFAGLIKKIKCTSDGDNIVILAPDSGFKYVDTIYNDSWINEGRDFYLKEKDIDTNTKQALK